MRIVGWVLLLSLIIIPVGAITAYAQLFLDEDDPRMALPLSIWTDLPLYDDGDPVVFKGHIKNLDSNNMFDITVRVVGPLVNQTSTNIVQVLQIRPQLNGDYQGSFITSGPLWVNKGDYKILVNYGPQRAETTFFYNGGTGTPISERPPPPPPIQCGANEVLQNGVCVPFKAPPPACGPGTVLDAATGMCVVAPPVECPPGTMLSGGVCIDEPPQVTEPPVCGTGTILQDGICVPAPRDTGGCLIATAAFGSELAPQVQLLREVRDNVLLKTGSGAGFMGAFNSLYYSFSPTVADWERDSPVFKEVVKTAITPMLSTLSILNYVEIDSESQMLGYGIGIILLNIGMYFVVPAVVIVKIRDLLQKRHP